MKNLAAIIIIALAALLYSLNIREGQIGHVNDDAYYINAARWFAGVQREQKQLSSRSLGFSLLLAPVARAAGESLLPFRLVSLFFALASLWLIWLIFRKIASPAVCFSVLLLAAFNHLNLIFSTMVMSEEAYLFFSLLALWVFIRRENKGFSYGWALLQALTIAALSYIRPEGFLLAFSVFAVLLIWRRYRDALYSVFFFILLILPLVTNSFGIGSSLNKYVNELLFPVFYAGLWTVIKTGFIYFLTEISAVAFFTDVISSRMGIFEIPASLIVIVIIVYGICSRLKKNGSKKSFRPVATLFALYLVLYTAFHMIWPAKGARFVIPILSFIYYFFFSALKQWTDAGICVKAGEKILIPVTSVFLCMFAYQNYLILITPVSPLFPETFAYVKDSSKQGDVFVSESAERFFLKTGIKTASPPAYLTADDFYHFILSAGVTRAAFCGLPRLSTKYSEFPTMSSAGIKRYAVYLQNAQRFEKEYENKDEGTVIYRLNQTYAANFQKAYEIDDRSFE
ncbi:MAG: glycosyltransferase family 39 protein [Elusimicrobiota bacterium]|nr:glycosyltransferase family 39 protein [Elusimicrobiota bacterium]